MDSYFSNFNQKIRTKARVITDIAIEKIRCTRIPGFTTEQNAFIQERHKELLQEAKTLNVKYQTDDMEAGILIDLVTWDYELIDGVQRREVDMSKSPKALQKMDTSYKNSLMFMHNHPSTGTFSGEDFKTFCNQDSLYFMTVVGNDGIIYVLMKTIFFDKEIALIQYGNLANKYAQAGFKNNGTKAIHEILNNATRYGLVYKRGVKA